MASVLRRVQSDVREQWMMVGAEDRGPAVERMLVEPLDPSARPRGRRGRERAGSRAPARAARETCGATAGHGGTPAREARVVQQPPARARGGPRPRLRSAPRTTERRRRAARADAPSGSRGRRRRATRRPVVRADRDARSRGGPGRPRAAGWPRAEPGAAAPAAARRPTHRAAGGRREWRFPGRCGRRRSASTVRSGG